MANRLFRDESETSDLPTICDYCLSDNPNCAPMNVEGCGKECKICTRLFTVLRFVPGPGSGYKKMDTCQFCSKKNDVCRHCLPMSEFAEDHDQKARGRIGHESSSYGKMRPIDNISKMWRRPTYYKRKVKHLCCLFQRGECTMGLECPYRHEMPIAEELSRLNINHRN